MRFVSTRENGMDFHALRFVRGVHDSFDKFSQVEVSCLVTRVGMTYFYKDRTVNTI